MSDRIEKAARAIRDMPWSENPPSPHDIARVLDAAGMLAPDTTDEWDVLVDGRYILNVQPKTRDSAEAMTKHGILVRRHVTSWEAAGEHYTAANVEGSRA